MAKKNLTKKNVVYLIERCCGRYNKVSWYKTQINFKTLSFNIFKLYIFILLIFVLNYF